MRAVAAGVCVLVFLASTAPSAFADESPREVCVLSDERLPEVSGLVADGDQWYVVNDGGSQLEVFVLTSSCAVERTITAPVNPYDVEDLARDADGAFWLADIGDNRQQRETVALHELTADGQATLYRLTYPDGPHDAEALLLDGDGIPHIVTKNVLGRSGVYRPAASLSSPGPTPLERVDTVSISATTTSGGPVGTAGSVLVTGGAVSHDGSVAALRTYTDAYLYPTEDGDVRAALERDPVRIPLPDERQGEAIAFEPDGTLLSASEGMGEPVRAVPDATERVSSDPAGSTESSADRSVETEGNEQSPAPAAGEEIDDSPSAQWPMLAAATVVAAVGWLGARRLRR